MAVVSFHAADRTLKLKNKLLLRRFLKKMFHEEQKDLKRLTYIFCSNDYLLEINKKFLDHDYYTDIITFDLSETSEVIGELYISLDQVKTNSQDLQNTFQEEILRVIFHGALHLCGYKDKKKQEIELMRSKEDYYLTAFKEFTTSVSRETKTKNQ